MGINNKYFEYCGELGLMKENYTKADALETLKEELRKENDINPKFLEAVEKITLDSSAIDMRVVVLYHVDIDVKYLCMGEWDHGTISENRCNGVPDALHIFDFEGEGEYKILNNASQVPYASWNDKNLFTLDEMKNALKGVIEDRLPARTARWEATGWNVNAYFVPVFSVDVPFNNKEYTLYFNLHNGYYHYEWPTNPEITNKAKKEKTFTTIFKLASIVLSIIGTVVSFGSNSDGAFILPAILTAIQLFVFFKFKKDLDDYRDKYEKKPKRNPISSAVLNSLLFIILAVVALAAGLSA